MGALGRNGEIVALHIVSGLFEVESRSGKVVKLSVLYESRKEDVIESG